MVVALFSRCKVVDGHAESVHFIQFRHNLSYRLSTPAIKQVLVKVAVPLLESSLPRYIVQRHRVGNCAITVEKISEEVAGGQFELHAERRLLGEMFRKVVRS